MRGIDAGDLPVGRVTNYVALETLNWIHERQRHDIAADRYNRLTTSVEFQLIHSTQKDYHRAVELFETYNRLAFGNATIVAYMECEDIEYLYSFDDDFGAIDWLMCLGTQSNPFV